MQVNLKYMAYVSNACRYWNIDSIISNIFEMILNYLALTTGLLIKESSKVKLMFLLSQIRQPILLRKTRFLLVHWYLWRHLQQRRLFLLILWVLLKPLNCHLSIAIIVYELKEKNICVWLVHRYKPHKQNTETALPMFMWWWAFEACSQICY